MKRRDLLRLFSRGAAAGLLSLALLRLIFREGASCRNPRACASCDKAAHCRLPGELGGAAGPEPGGKP